MKRTTVIATAIAATLSLGGTSVALAAQSPLGSAACGRPYAGACPDPSRRLLGLELRRRRRRRGVRQLGFRQPASPDARLRAGSGPGLHRRRQRWGVRQLERAGHRAGPGLHRRRQRWGVRQLERAGCRRAARPGPGSRPRRQGQGHGNGNGNGSGWGRGNR